MAFFLAVVAIWKHTHPLNTIGYTIGWKLLWKVCQQVETSIILPRYYVCWSTTIHLCITYCYNFGCSDKYTKGYLFFLVLTYGYWTLANKDFCRRNSDLIAAPLESGEKGLLCSNHSLVFSWRSNGKDILLCSNPVLHPIITNGIFIITVKRKHPESGLPVSFAF